MKKKLLIDYRFCEIADKKWGSEFEILPSPMMENLDAPVCGHPDLSLCAVGDTFVAEKTAYAYYREKLAGKRVICGETTLDKHYPSDIAYNVLISENKAFANIAHLDSVVKKTLFAQNIQLISVKQGYARCSTVVLENGLISADPSIICAALSAGVDVLPIAPGMVELAGYDYGFLGGASGFIDNRLFFFGNLKKHKNFSEIKDFVSKKGVIIEYIDTIPLTDVGTIIGIDV